MTSVAHHLAFDAIYKSDDGLTWTKVNLGKLQKNIICFACKYPGLHSYNPKEIDRMRKLSDYGLIELFEDSAQFQVINGRII